MTTKKIEELPAFLTEEVVYPIDQGTVIDRYGTIIIEAPNRQESKTIEGIIGTLSTETYDTPDELFDTIIGNVSDEYIGRKYYDDRGNNVKEMSIRRGGGRDEDNPDISF